MNSKEIETQAPTVEEAIQKGLESLKVEKDQVDVKILDEGSTGLFGLMGAKPAIVRLKFKKPSKTETEPHAEDTKETSGTSPVENKAKKIVDDILRLMNVEDTSVKVYLRSNAVHVDIETPESSVLIGKQGKTLQALQFLVSLLIARDQDNRAKLYLDVNGYRKQCEEKLKLQARNAALEVKQKGEELRLDPMPAMDRRIIHLTLENDPEVVTESEGSGSFRAVLIKPKK